MSSLSFIATDAEANLVVFQYQPEARESNGGQRLMRRADFNVGALRIGGLGAGARRMGGADYVLLASQFVGDC